MILKRSITARFITALVLVLLIGQSVAAVATVMYARSKLLGSLEMRMSRAASITAGMSSGPLLSYDYAPIDTYIEEIMRDKEITAIRILDGQGRIARERVRPAESEGAGINPFLLKKTMTMKVPVVAAGEKIGEVVIDYTSKGVNDDISKSVVMTALFQAIMLVVVSVVVILLFNRHIKRPVSRINSAIEKVTTGDLTAAVPDLGENEIGGIAKGLGYLLDKLSSSISRFNSVSNSAATAVEQLTTAVKNISEAAKRQSRQIDGVISGIRAANDSQRKTTENTDRLSRVSSENVTSLLQMKAAAEEIAASTGRLFKSTGDSYAMIAEMSQTAKMIAENSNEVSHAVEDTSASVEEITVSLNAVRENTKKSSELTALVRVLLTERGTLAVADAIEAMERIAEEVDSSAKIITRLDERSKDIEKMLSVIKEVTEKTNLLSLNAAILASQAGEYGKGFSVVADEIRALSDRTSASARDIANIVGTIQAEIHEAVTAIQTGVKKVDEGKELIFKSGEAMGETLEAAQKSAQMAKLIEKATEEQAGGLRQIQLAMENVRFMIEQVAKATEEEKRGTSHMLDSISDVKEVAELVKKGTEEHAIGTDIISKNLGLGLDMVSQINRSAQDQLKVNEGIIASVEQMKSAGGSSLRDMEAAALSFNSLRDKVEVLKREMELFKTGASDRSADS